MNTRHSVTCAGLILSAGLAWSVPALAAEEKEPEFPPFDKVSEDFVEVVSTADGVTPFYRVWKRDKDAQLLAELPKDFESGKFFVVPTVAGGDTQMGVYSIWHYLIGRDARYVHWKRYDKKLVLLEPNLKYRTSGDAESQSATNRVYTDTVVLTAPIVCMGPGGGPVIDLDRMLVNDSDKFFGRFTQHADFGLTRIESAKAFPHNLEFTISFPRASGQLAKIHYSIGAPPPDPSYKPREADRRVGIYYEDFVDRGKYDEASPKKRYVTRWHLEKADPSLKLSPPKQPIVYYIEYTTPIRYRRWVREGILAWNRAFEQVGLLNAIEVYQQDARTGAHMDKDPEDLRYSFVRWTNASMGFAIGPAHSNPETGQIYEADIVMDENFLRSWRVDRLDAELAAAAMSSMDEDLADWLGANPTWDPRYRFARPADRAAVLRYQRALAEGTADGLEPPPTMASTVWFVHRKELGLPRTACMYQYGASFGITMMRDALALDLLGPVATDGEDDEQGSVLDGLPEEFVGPMLKDVIMHEVGHTMGLMHNWKGSAAHDFGEINSESMRGVEPLAGTVMDYTPTNIVVAGDEIIQGDRTNIDIGPYDMWAIEWAYTFDDPEPIARRAAEPGLGFSAEEGQAGPDPQSKVWDIGEFSVDQSKALMDFVRTARNRIIERGVKDNQSWQKARELYGHLVGMQFRALTVASNWIGAAYVNKYRRGDPGADDPFRPVEVERQRAALAFVIDNALRDDAYDLDPDLLAKLAVDQWYDEGFDSSQDYPIHDQILAIQAVTLTMLMNPTRLRRIQDNELRVPADEDALTVPELLNAIRDAVWFDPPAPAGDGYTDRNPMFTSTQRNLQREHLDRLIDLARGMPWPNASGATIATLARQQLRDINGRIDRYAANDLDDYTLAHLNDSRQRIDSALEAAYIRVD